MVEPDMKTMLELVREFDDRGRILYAAVDVEIADDAEVPEPKGRGRQRIGVLRPAPCEVFLHSLLDKIQPGSSYSRSVMT